MRAAMITEQGGNPVVVDIAWPEARDGATLVEVDAAALGPTDLARAAGTWRPYPGPHVINGEGIGWLADGTRVYFFHSLAPHGSVAVRALVASDFVWPVPAGVGDDQAAVIGSAATAALVSLETARVRSGDRVLVLGATGVAGRAGLQIARAMGAGVVAAAGRDGATLDALREQGLADITVQIGQGDDLTALKGIAGSGWDVVLDIVFGEPAEAALKTSAKGARIVTMGKFAGDHMTIAAADLGSRSITSVGTNDMDGPERRAAYERLSALVVAGKLRVATRVFPLAGISDAWLALASSPHAKVVVRVRSPE